MKIEVFAPAKLNLTLHVTGQQADGYHLLDSLVVFANIGDQIAVENCGELKLQVSGPFAGDVPADSENLVLTAAYLLSGDHGALINLQKVLPVASGLGGGSSDAAAALLALSDLWNISRPDMEATLALGADVPVCLTASPVRMTGVGQHLAAFFHPQIYLVLVNPGVAVSTLGVFANLANKTNSAMPETLPDWHDGAHFAGWLAKQRNDLEEPARDIAPDIGSALEYISASNGCLLARMSGSGATCFGIFDHPDAAKLAAQTIARQQPGWWVRDAQTWCRPS